MADLSQLKNQARREEERGNLARAIELYRRAIRESEASGELTPDISLYNRIGDLYLREQKSEEAVEHYLGAVDRYAELGLHSAAVALCNKVLRIAPERVGVHRTLGRLYVSTGLLAEARESFWEFASRMEERGDEDLSLEALVEFAELSGDEDLHLQIIDRLTERGDTELAVTQLRILRERRSADGTGAEELRERILELDPSAEFAEVPESEAETSPAAVPSPDSSEPEGDGEEDSGSTDAGAGSEESSVAAGDAGRAEASPAAAPPPTVESTADTAEAGPSDAIEEAVPEREIEERTEREPRESAEASDSPVEYVDLGALIRRKLGSEEATGETDDLRERKDFDEMLVGFRAQVADTSGEADPAAHCELGIALRQMGLLEDAIREFQIAARASDPPVRAFELLGECFIDQELLRVAIRVLTRALRIPGRTEFELLGVLYQLGTARQALGETEKALECFERVYSVDIDFRDVAERMRACAS